MKGIEIPFRAKDSELGGWEYTIPEGMEAVVEGGKVIVRRKESEDERIRRDIIHYILYKADGVSEEQEHSWIAYLEKQKEPLTPEEKMNHPLYLEGFDVGREVGAVVAKPAERSEEEAPDETKQEWGSVDIPGSIKTSRIETLKNIISYFKYERKATQEEIRISFIPCLENLLEEIEQQPAEWSEEDEKLLDFWLDVIDRNDWRMDENFCKASRKFIERLKSIRPAKDCSSCAKNLEGYISGRSDAENKLLEQFGALITPEDELRIKPRWKPSEEQMDALSDAYVDASTFKKGDILKSLYNDLSKL